MTALVVPARRWEPALAATGLAVQLSAPILLVEDAGISTATRAYLAESTITEAIVIDDVGGQAADDILALGIDVSTVNASSPVALSTALADLAVELGRGPTTGVLATSSNFADVVALGGPAALAEETLERLVSGG